MDIIPVPNHRRKPCNRIDRYPPYSSLRSSICNTRSAGYPPVSHRDLHPRHSTEGEAARYIREVTEAIHQAHADSAANRTKRGRQDRSKANPKNRRPQRECRGGPLEDMDAMDCGIRAVERAQRRGVKRVRCAPSCGVKASVFPMPAAPSVLSPFQYAGTRFLLIIPSILRRAACHRRTGSVWARPSYVEEHQELADQLDVDATGATSGAWRTGVT